MPVISYIHIYCERDGLRQLKIRIEIIYWKENMDLKKSPY